MWLCIIEIKSPIVYIMHDAEMEDFPSLSLPSLKCKSWERWQKTSFTHGLQTLSPRSYTSLLSHISPPCFNAVDQPHLHRHQSHNNWDNTFIPHYFLLLTKKKTPVLDVLEDVFFHFKMCSKHEIELQLFYSFYMLFTPSSLATAKLVL